MHGGSSNPNLVSQTFDPIFTLGVSTLRGSWGFGLSSCLIPGSGFIIVFWGAAGLGFRFSSADTGIHIICLGVCNYPAKNVGPSVGKHP